MIQNDTRSVGSVLSLSYTKLVSGIQHKYIRHVKGQFPHIHLSPCLALACSRAVPAMREDTQTKNSKTSVRANTCLLNVNKSSGP